MYTQKEFRTLITVIDKGLLFMLSLLVRKARKRDRTAFQKLMKEMALPMYKTAKAILKNGEAIPEMWSHEYGYVNAEWEMLLNCLDEKSRLLIMLYYVQGYKTREIAEILNENENTVRGRLSVARKKLKRQYENEERKEASLKAGTEPKLCEGK